MGPVTSVARCRASHAPGWAGLSRAGLCRTRIRASYTRHVSTTPGPSSERDDAPRRPDDAPQLPENVPPPVVEPAGDRTAPPAIPEPEVPAETSEPSTVAADGDASTGVTSTDANGAASYGVVPPAQQSRAPWERPDDVAPPAQQSRAPWERPDVAPAARPAASQRAGGNEGGSSVYGHAPAPAPAKPWDRPAGRTKRGTEPPAQPWDAPASTAPHRVDDQHGFVPPADSGKTSPWVWIIAVGGLLLVVALIAAIGFFVSRVVSAAETAVDGFTTDEPSVAAQPVSPGGTTGANGTTGSAGSTGDAAQWQDASRADIDMSLSRGHLEGTGESTVELPADTEVTDVVVYSALEGSYAAFTVLDEAGEEINYLTYGSTPVSGTSILEQVGTSEPTARSIAVQAEGPWSIDVLPLDAAPLWAGEGPFEGRGNSVVRVQPGTEHTARVTHDGESNIAVWADPVGEGYSDLLVNEIGAIDEEVTIPADVTYLDIEADGAWTFTR